METSLDIVLAFIVWVVFLSALETILRANEPYEKKLYDLQKTHAALRSVRNVRQTNIDFPIGSTPSPETDQFPLMMLPPELRRQIWKFCLPGPRIIEADDDLSYSPEWKFKSSAEDLAILYVCIESRCVALEHYQPLFKADTPMGYFDPQIDTLCFSSGAHLFENDFQKYHVFKQISFIALLADPYSLRVKIAALADSPHGQWPLRRLVLFENLEKVYIVVGNLGGIWAEVSNCRLEPVTEVEDASPEEWELFNDGGAFRCGLDAIKGSKGLERVPVVVPARCVTAGRQKSKF